MAENRRNDLFPRYSQELWEDTARKVRLFLSEQITSVRAFSLMSKFSITKFGSPDNQAIFGQAEIYPEDLVNEWGWDGFFEYSHPNQHHYRLVVCPSQNLLFAFYRDSTHSNAVAFSKGDRFALYLNDLRRGEPFSCPSAYL